MVSDPLVSILIPNFNKEKYLKMALDSVILQTYKNWECIIVDDYSTDLSWSILEEYAKLDSRFKIYKRPVFKKSGGNSARNFALKLSKGYFINWFDSDDIMDIKMIEEKIKVFDQNSCLDFVLGNVIKFECSTENQLKINNLDLSQKDINYALNMIKGNFWIPTPSPLFKRIFLKDFEYCFDEELVWDQEIEFMSRVLLSNPKFEFTKDSIFYYRTGISSQTKNFKELKLADRQLLSFSSYKKIYSNFSKNKVKSKEEIDYFKWYFGVQLVTMRLKYPDFFDLLKFGLLNKTFPGYLFVIKILLYRFLVLIGVNFK